MYHQLEQFLNAVEFIVVKYIWQTFVPEMPAKPAFTTYFTKKIQPGRLIGIMQKDKIVMPSDWQVSHLMGCIWYGMVVMDYGYHIQNYRNEMSFSH